METKTVELIFWLFIGLCLYGYVGYPLLLIALSPLVNRFQSLPQSTQDCPHASILVAAYNEENYICTKLDSLLNQHYPGEKFDIWVLNDGSSDQTATLVKSYSDPRVHLLDLPRGGKANALNAGVKACTHDILVFSDADNEWAPDTLMRLLAPFTHTEIGAVSGHLSIRKNSRHLGMGDRLYRKYESIIRQSETKLGSAVSADGGIFAIRRALYDPLPQDVTDDFFISTGAVCHGKALVYQQSAIAYDDGVDKAENQLRRRVRVTVRGMTSLWRRRSLFNPFRFGWYSLCLLSHKLIRRFVPFFALLLLPLNVFLLTEHSFYSLSLLTQVVFYSVALAGLYDQGKRLPKVFSIASFALLSSYGLALGITKFIKGERFTFWSPEQNR